MFDYSREVILLGLEGAETEYVARTKRLIADFRLLAKGVSLYIRFRRIELIYYFEEACKCF